MTSLNRKLRDLAISTVEGARRKVQVIRSGHSQVATSCQIPQLRDRYRELGLSDRDGTFVEVGGFDGESWSNTSFLADQGWRGIYVEPIPHFARRIRLRHLFNKVQVEQVAITDKPGQMDIAVMGSLTTMNAATEDAYNSIAWAQSSVESKERLTVKTETLATVLQRNRVPKDFDLLVVDVEGAEEPIVDALIDSAWRPGAIIIELVDQHADFGEFAEIIGSHRATRGKILGAGYRESFSDHINTIFAREV